MPPISDVEADREVEVDRETPPDQVWSTLEEQTRQKVVSEFRRIVKEMIDEQFRYDTAATFAAASRDLRSTVKPQSSAHQQGESANAVRAA